MYRSEISYCNRIEYKALTKINNMNSENTLKEFIQGIILIVVTILAVIATILI